MDIRHYASYLSHDSCPVGAALELDEIRQILRDNIMVLVSVFHVSCYNWHRAKTDTRITSPSQPFCWDVCVQLSLHLICGKRKKWLAFQFSMFLEISFHRLLAHLTCVISYYGEWGKVFIFLFIAKSCQCIFYLLNGDHLNKKCNYYRKWKHIY